MRKRGWKLALLAGVMSAALIGGCSSGNNTAGTTAAETTAETTAEETAAQDNGAEEAEETAEESEEGTEAQEDGAGEAAQEDGSEEDGPLVIADQGIFSAGGITVTSEGTFDPENHWEETGAGQTSHVDHANVLYQIPEDETGLPMVFLHG